MLKTEQEIRDQLHYAWAHQGLNTGTPEIDGYILALKWALGYYVALPNINRTIETSQRPKSKEPL